MIKIIYFVGFLISINNIAFGQDTIRIEDIFKKRPATQLGDIIKIEVPKGVKDIFRIKTTADGIAKYLFYDTDGNEIKYDY